MARARTTHDNGEAAVFPAPGHDHDRCTSDAMAVAEARCTERGQRLTPIRGMCWARCWQPPAARAPTRSWNGWRLGGPRPAPITVYRALEFLRENGLRSPDRKPQRVRCLCAQPCRRRSRGVPDLRTLRHGRGGLLVGGRQHGEIGRACRRFHAEIAGDRGRRHLHALQARVNARALRPYVDAGAVALALVNAQMER